MDGDFSYTAESEASNGFGFGFPCRGQSFGVQNFWVWGGLKRSECLAPRKSTPKPVLVRSVFSQGSMSGGSDAGNVSKPSPMHTHAQSLQPGCSILCKVAMSLRLEVGWGFFYRTAAPTTEV